MLKYMNEYLLLFYNVYTTPDHYSIIKIIWKECRTYKKFRHLIIRFHKGCNVKLIYFVSPLSFMKLCYRFPCTKLNFWSFTFYHILKDPHQWLINNLFIFFSGRYRQRGSVHMRKNSDFSFVGSCFSYNANQFAGLL